MAEVEKGETVSPLFLWIFEICLFAFGLIMFAIGNWGGIFPILLAILVLTIYIIKKGKAKYKVEEGVKAGAKFAKEQVKKIIPIGGGGIWLVLRGIGIGLFVALIGYFAYFAYQGYSLGTLGGVGLILTIIAGLVILFFFLKFLSKKGLPPATMLLIIILIIAAIYGLYYMNKVGLFTKGAIQFEKVNLLDRVKITFSTIQEKFTSYIYSFGTWTAPETIEKGKPVGVEFESFAARRGYFRAGKDEISTIALVKVYGLPDRDTKVYFDCSMEGEKPKKITISGSENNGISIPMKQEFSIHQVICTFDPGYEHPEKGNVLVKRVDLTASYENFATISKLKVYTMDEKELRSIESEGENPFKVYGIEDPLLTEERKTIPTQDTNTPIELWLNLPLMQPLTASTEFYTLGFKLKHNKVRWKGQVEKISEILFQFPSEFNVQVENHLKKDTYITLSSEAVKPMNEQLNSGKLSSDTNYIDFKVLPGNIQEELSYHIIKAMAVYDYSFKTSTTVEIVEEKGF